MLKKCFVRVLIVAAMGWAPNFAHANDKSSGCGLGWYVFKKNSLVSSTLRSTTNALFFNQTFGMTFGTSNCAKHDIIMNDKKSLHYVEANIDNLMLAAARGQGEHLGAFAATLGCGWHAQAAFNANLRRNYDTIFVGDSDTQAVDVIGHVKHQIMQEPALATECSHISA